jgi:hypothetical protein
MGGRGSGRTPPAYLEDGRVITILTALASGNTRTAAAAYAGINRGTFYKWLERRPSFARAVEKAEADAEVRAAATVLKAAQKGTWQAAAWWLERRRPADYGLRGRLDVHVELEREVRKLALAAGVDYESALAEAERILRNAQQNDRGPGPSY